MVAPGSMSEGRVPLKAFFDRLSFIMPVLDLKSGRGPKKEQLAMLSTIVRTASAGIDWKKAAVRGCASLLDEISTSTLLTIVFTWKKVVGRGPSKRLFAKLSDREAVFGLLG